VASSHYKILETPGASLNTAARRNLARLDGLLKTAEDARLLNLGSGDRFLGKESLDLRRYKKVVMLDIRPFASVDVVGDAHRLPFQSGSFHGVICQAVLEHVRFPEIVVEEISRVLLKGGFVYAEVPFLQGYHPTPEDYRRYTMEGIESLFPGFSRLDSGVCVGPSSALSLMLREYLSGLLTGFGDETRARRLARRFAAWLTFPVKYLDLVFADRPGAGRIASGLFYLGKKC